MSDLALQISENRLQELVLLLQDELIIEDLLHGVQVADLGKHGQPLQLIGVLGVVQDGLRDDHVSFNLVRQVAEVGPAFLGLHFEAVEH